MQFIAAHTQFIIVVLLVMLSMMASGGLKVFWLVNFVISTWLFVFWMSTFTTDMLSAGSIIEMMAMAMVSFKALVFFINVILELTWTVITQFFMTYDSKNACFFKVYAKNCNALQNCNESFTLT